MASRPVTIIPAIEERPVPPKRRLPFPLLMLRMIGNPLGSWAEEFYTEPVVLYRWLGLETLFVMEPGLIQKILLDEIENYSRQPINDDVFGEAIGGGLLNAEGEDWRWQRRLAAPLFRAEDVAAYVPAFAASASRVHDRWREAGAPAVQPIHQDMTRATLEALRDSVLGANLKTVAISSGLAQHFSSIRCGRSR